LEFHFDKNEYFSNSVLTKQYVLKSTVDPNDPFAFEGPEIYKCTVSYLHSRGQQGISNRNKTNYRGAPLTGRRR